MNGDNEKQEIIIVRRIADDEHAHHGGAWKIAFADFMTAMMALFLVLWLVNAANEETKKAVASYFNPVQLVDRNRSSKGLENSDGPAEINGAGDAETPSAENLGTVEGEQKNADHSAAEAKFFQDPQTAMDDIVTENEASTLEAARLESGPAGLTDLDKNSIPEPAFIDPFSPGYYQIQSDGAKQEENEDKKTAARKALGDAEEGMRKEGLEADKQAEISKLTAEIIEQKLSEQEPPNPAQELSKSVAETINSVSDVLGLSSDQISVVAQNDAVLISLSDNLNFSMFGIGSAVPKAELVNAIGVIGGVLADKKNARISIVGHTDGRPYKSGVYDNWRLSAARAEATLYMLVRGGIDESRIISVTGKADRELKNANDSFAPENRRIDILVQLEKE